MFEKLERGYANHLPNHVREALEPIFEGGESHNALNLAYARLNQELERDAASIQVDDILDVLMACETAAKQFYATHARELHDPALARLFEGLAADEGRHATAVELAQSIARPDDFT
jgi:rubrerythrin